MNCIIKNKAAWLGSLKNITILYFFLFISACSNTPLEHEDIYAGVGSELKVGDIVILDGLYTWGHEVVSFEPCGSNVQYWATGETTITKPLNEASFNKAVARKSPYQPIFIRTKIKVLPPAQEGFAESYDGLIELLDVKKLLTDKDCDSK
jgi:hypothetical protein